MTTPTSTTVRATALKLMAIVTFATLGFVYFLIPLFIELHISLFGEETEASVIRAERLEGEDDDGRPTSSDLINYKFRTKDGYIFAGVKKVNSSAAIIRYPNTSGRYPKAHVEYVRSRPQWHRLKDSGYKWFGPSGSTLWILIRFAIASVLVLFAFLYAFDRLNRTLRE